MVINMKKILYVFLISMVPLIELRCAVPAGALLGIPWYINYAVCIIGNMLPVPIILLFVKAVLNYMAKCKISLFNKIADFIYRKADKNKGRIEKGATIGLILFVGIPIPGTGAWTGALVAALLDMKLKHSIPAIFAGVVLAGIIMGLISYISVDAFNALF